MTKDATDRLAEVQHGPNLGSSFPEFVAILPVDVLGKNRFVEQDHQGFPGDHANGKKCIQMTTLAPSLSARTSGPASFHEVHEGHLVQRLR